MSIRIRRATAKDLDLVTWVMLAASRSHLERGIWEYLNATDEARTLTFLRRVATTDAVHLFHHSLFLIAELDGEPVGCTQLSFIPGLMRRGMWRGLIELVHVRADRRNLGLGTQMMHLALDRCRDRGCHQAGFSR